AVKDSVQKTTAMIQGFKAAINSIDSALIKEWVEDLLYDKTFYGFNLESTIKLFFIDKGLTVQNATAGDESKNIDLYVNGKPYQIKPKSLEHKQSIKSYIGIPIIYYYKEENSLVIDCDDKYLSALL
ncbi:MAG: MjaI family restriction endonuclease, partial [bacterium]|nr:MjaI family restriction endonuclease [bacterium]